MTQDTHTPRRTVRVGDDLWAAFMALHGERGTSARLRALMLRDLEEQRTSPTQWYLQYLEDQKREQPPAEDQGPSSRNSIEQTKAG